MPIESGQPMLATDLASLHSTTRARVNAATLGRSSLNHRMLPSLVKANNRQEVTSTVTIANAPSPFAQTAANALTWDEPVEYLMTPGIQIQRPFLLIAYLTLNIYEYGGISSLDDPYFWFTLKLKWDGANDIDPVAFRALQGQAIRYADGTPTWQTLFTGNQGHLVTLERRKIFAGTGVVTLNELSLLACTPDYRLGWPPWNIDSGVIGFTALHYPG
jgi:hypothetical protein